MAVKKETDLEQQSLQNAQIGYKSQGALLKKDTESDYDEDEYESSDEEENAIIELDQVSILASSRTSLKQRKSLKKKSDQKKQKHQIYKSEEQLLAFNERSCNNKELAADNEASSTLSKYKGILLAFFSAFLTSIVVITIKKAFLYTASEQLVIRNFIQAIIMIIIGKYKKIDMLGPKKYRKLLVLRGSINTLSMSCAYFAISFINPSDQSAIVQSSIIITAIFARIFLKEKLSIIHIFALGFTIMGVAFISQPSFLFPADAFTTITTESMILNTTTTTSVSQAYANCTSNGTAGIDSRPCMDTTEKVNLNVSNLNKLNNLYLLGITLAIFESLGRSSSQVILKKLAVKKVHYAITNLYTVFTGMPFAVLLSLILIMTGYSQLFVNFRTRPDELLEQTVLLCIVAAVGTCNQIIFNLALKYDDVFKISVVKTADLFFVILLQTIFLDININWLNLIGVLMIFTSTMIILMFKYCEERYLESVENADQPLAKEIEAKMNEAELNGQAEIQSSRISFQKIIFFKF